MRCDNIAIVSVHLLHKCRKLRVCCNRGGPLEWGLRRVVHNVPIGSLLIQSEAKTGEPLLLHLSLPVCLRDRRQAENTWVFLLDAQVRFPSLPRLPFELDTHDA